MALSVVSFTPTFDYALGIFVFTDTSDYPSQGVTTADVLGNFKIIDPNGVVVWNNLNYGQQTGTAQSGGATNIVLASGASATDNFYNNLYVIITGGTGSGQTRRVSAYNGTTKIATVSVAWGTNPDNTSTYKFSFSDLVPQAALTNQTLINLSLSQGGVPIAGTYQITYTVKDINTGVYAVDAQSFNFSFVAPAVDLTQQVNCLIPQLTAIDNTNYVVNGVTPTIVRTHTLYPPASLSLPPITGTGTDLAITNFYTPATYEHTLSSVLTYDFGTYQVTVTVTGQQFINVTCSNDLCDIFCCVKTLWNNYIDNKVSNPTQANIYLSKLTQVTSIMELIRQAYECSQGDSVAPYIAEILQIANCTPGCGCTGNAPIPVTGLGGNGTTVVVSQGNGITVTSNTVGSTTTYTVSISNSILNAINNIPVAATVVGATNITVVESPTGTWTVTGATVTALADTQLPTTTSIVVTPNGSPVTDYDVQYVGRNYKLLKDYAPVTAGTTTGTVEEVIAAATYNFAGGIATTAGDKVRTRSEFYLTNASAVTNSTVRLRIGGIGGTAVATWNIVYNLVSGAVTYTTNVGVVLKIDVSYITATTARVLIQVQPILNGFLYLYNGGEIMYDGVVSIPTFASAQDWVCTIEETASGAAGRTELRYHSLEFIPKV